MKSKKVIVALSLVLALGLSVFAVADTSSSIKIGDTNGDGIISAADALEILQYSVGKINKFIAETCKSTKLGDTNGDGNINATDALEVLQYVVGKIDKFSVETSSSVEFDAYINGVGYSLGQELTFDIILTTNDTDIIVCPCFTVYKKVNNNWEPYDIEACFENFWGEEPTITGSTSGPVYIDADNDDEYITYGMWCWMGTGLRDGDDNFDFSNGQVIQRFKLTVIEKGEFEFRIRDGVYYDQNYDKYTDSLSIKIY